MLSIFRSNVRHSTLLAGVGALMMVSMFDAPLLAQTLTGVGGGSVCSINGALVVYTNQDTCDFSEPGSIQQPDGFLAGNADFDGAFGTTTFTNGTVSFNSVTTAFGGGSVSFNAPVTFTGSSATFSTSTTFQNPATFNGTTNFTAGMTTANIANSGGITTSTLNATTGLTVSAGANVNMGGNQIHGVGAGTAATDAVNVAQLNAATAGIATDISALETTVATQGDQIAAVEAVNTTQATQITAINTVNTTQSNQIAAIETVNTTQAGQITAIQAVNTTQSGQIGELFAGQDFLSGQVDTLFDLRGRDRRDMKQGVAAAMSMAQAPMPSAPGKVSYAVNGAAFRGEYAVGGSLMYRLPTEAPMAVNVGASFAGNKNNGVRVGVAGEF